MSHLLVNKQKLLLNDGEDFLSCLDRHNLAPEVKCGGIGQCGDCVVKVTQGAEALTPMTLKEQQLLGNVFFITKERLACQCSCEVAEATIVLSEV